jgi:hypothetical protein
MWPVHHDRRLTCFQRECVHKTLHRLTGPGSTGTVVPLMPIKDLCVGAGNWHAACRRALRVVEASLFFGRTKWRTTCRGCITRMRRCLNCVLKGVEEDVILYLSCIDCDQVLECLAVCSVKLSVFLAVYRGRQSCWIYIEEGDSTRTKFDV